MDWLSALSILSPEWFLFAVIIAAVVTVFWYLIENIADIKFNEMLVFIIALAVILLLKIEGWYDVVSVVEGWLSSTRAAQGVILWML